MCQGRRCRLRGLFGRGGGVVGPGRRWGPYGRCAGAIGAPLGRAPRSCALAAALVRRLCGSGASRAHRLRAARALEAGRSWPARVCGARLAHGGARLALRTIALRGRLAARQVSPSAEAAPGTSGDAVHPGNLACGLSSDPAGAPGALPHLMELSSECLCNLPQSGTTLGPNACVRECVRRFSGHASAVRYIAHVYMMPCAHVLVHRCFPIAWHLCLAIGRRRVASKRPRCVRARSPPSLAQIPLDSSPPLNNHLASQGGLTGRVEAGA